MPRSECHQVATLHMLTQTQAVGPHVVGLAILSWIALGWQYIGYIVSDKFAYFFLDHKQVGWEWVVGSWILFAIANNICMCFWMVSSWHFADYYSLLLRLWSHCRPSTIDQERRNQEERLPTTSAIAFATQSTVVTTEVLIRMGLVWPATFF